MNTSFLLVVLIFIVVVVHFILDLAGALGK